MTDPHAGARADELPEWIEEQLAFIKKSAPNVSHEARQLATELWGMVTQAYAKNATHGVDTPSYLRVVEDGVVVRVAGSRMESSINTHYRALFILLDKEQRKPLPDDTLIATLCDGVRLVRELSAYLDRRFADIAAGGGARSALAVERKLKKLVADSVLDLQFALGAAKRREEALRALVLDMLHEARCMPQISGEQTADWDARLRAALSSAPSHGERP